MANNEELSSKSTMRLKEKHVNYQGTMLHVNSISNKSYIDQDISIKKLQENNNLSELIGLTYEKKLDYENDSFECSFLLSSTLHFDDECKQNEVSIQSSSCSDNAEPSTSTPTRKTHVTTQKYKLNRPRDLFIDKTNDKYDCNDVKVEVNQCSPVHSPFPSLDKTLDLDNSFIDLNDTIQPSNYDSPPIGIELDKRAKRMMHLFKQYGLSHFVFIFIEQEVDLDLFLTLTKSDLKEIGIKRKRDRDLILSVIEECNCRNLMITL